MQTSKPLPRAYLTAIAVALIAAWSWALFSSLVADNVPLSVTAVSLLYLSSCYAIYRSTKSGFTLPLPVLFLSAGILTLLAFWAWATLTQSLFLPAFIPTNTRGQRIALLFLNAPMVSFLTGLVLAFPVKSLLKTFWWLPLVGGASIALLIEFPALLSPAGSHSTTRAVMAAEIICFYVVVPLTVMVANNSFKPKPLRGSA